MNFEWLFKGVGQTFSARRKFAPVDLQNGEFVKGERAVKALKSPDSAMVKSVYFLSLIHI